LSRAVQMVKFGGFTPINFAVRGCMQVIYWRTAMLRMSAGMPDHPGSDRSRL
jgi:hypothetical protein